MTRAHRPHRVEEALEALAEEGAVAVAGCTDLMVGDALARSEPAAVVDLSGIDALRGVIETSDGLWIGAGTTFAELRASAAVREQYPIVAEMAATIGALQIQSRATVGGNVVNASPAGDSLPVWLALDATAHVVGEGGERAVPYADLHTGYRQTAVGRGELLLALTLPPRGAEDVQRFRKVGTRAAQAISKVVVAFGARRADGVLRDVRLAAGSVAPVPLRVAAAEALCDGRAPTPECAAEAGLAAAAEVAPIDDVRSTAAYRRAVLARVVRRMLQGCDEDSR